MERSDPWGSGSGGVSCVSLVSFLETIRGFMLIYKRRSETKATTQQYPNIPRRGSTGAFSLMTVLT